MYSKKVDSMLFNYETTTKTDYQKADMKRPVKTLYEDKVPRSRDPPTPLKAWETMNDWKPVLIDHEREQVQKTRPRVILTPGSILDDLEEPARQQLLDGMYLTNEKYMMREAVKQAATNLNIRAPLPKTYSPTKPIFLPRFRPPFVSPEWRMESMKMEKNSIRGYVEPNKEFWTSQTPHKYSACEQSAGLEALNKM